MITIINYHMGNLSSVKNALERLGEQSDITDDKDKIASADTLILPGVGAAGEAMNNLRKLDLIEPIREKIAEGTRFLGICLGMQVLFEYSEENDTECLGIIKGSVKKFSFEDKILKVPHMGWNDVKLEMKNERMKKLKNNIQEDPFVYFVHSYYCVPTEDITIGTTEYGIEFTSMVEKENVYALQFHPEKSGAEGLNILKEIM